MISLGRVAGAIEMRLKTCRVSATCPACGTSCRKVHSRYGRRLADLPWHGVPVVIHLQTRRFFCLEPGCRRKVFTEPLPGTVSRYGRRSCRSSEALRWMTLSLGGRAGARLAERLGLLASRSTLLRELHHRRPAAVVQAPRVLGIDDWAWRKGHRYGTILCDLETRKVVDLLPDRDANTVAAWLRRHPGTEIISRDRGGIYAEAARRAAPQAMQVADRWHLLRNLSEALCRAIAPHHRLFSQAARASRLEDLAPAPPSVAPWSQRELLVQQANRQRRYERWQQVRELFLKTGAPDQELARQLGIDHRTVKKFRIAEVYPEAKPRVRESIVDDHASYLDRRLREGCRSSTILWRELRKLGFQGQVNSVRYWLRQRRSYRTRAASPPQRPALRASPRQVVWLILKAAPFAKDMLEEVYQTSPEISQLAQLATSFFRIFRERDLAALTPWLEAAHGTALAAFAAGLERDFDAVREALRLPWSQGHVEGQVHRLKLIKRQMYGRAGFELLRLRVLQQG
ncbi:transposase IS204/IS1001/IS1096/IS1165 family protein (plasmid) [Granulicella tundricola MP5ACTX9]|uniref:Transposase IS204/IS1001/IS1096/IS1165 family protein n=1 Tax=Granulicella tundricola (strain ATCC BAA-1859 / DSM 23138 / MP5ACTX9) TaxID=1198114 RepID=E8X831_GRATM|nr:transposase IS204/IS1001/IS1096/IS1165 family protein [Granulicella tundricola MP5ACTX9]